MKNTLTQLRDKIKAEKKYIGIRQYSHNIITILLNEVAQDYGYVEADKCIEELGLEALGWTKEYPKMVADNL
jgi:hypothetical protein